MAAVDAKKHSKKRKVTPEEEAPVPALPPPSFPQNVGLEMGSEDEGEEPGDESDDGEVEAFPEIDARSDTDDEDYEDEGEDDSEEDEEEDEEQETSEDGSDEDMHIFPKAKTVISDITGQPKRIYPEIEPDYDSDSSTEDVRDFTEYYHGHPFLDHS